MAAIGTSQHARMPAQGRRLLHRPRSLLAVSVSYGSFLATFVIAGVAPAGGVPNALAGGLAIIIVSGFAAAGLLRIPRARHPG